MAKFTPESARAAAAKRHRREGVMPAEPGAVALEPETARVVVPPPPAEAQQTIMAPASSGDTAPAGQPAAAAATDGVFTPEVAKLLAKIAFDVAGVATGRPEVYRATDEELDPLAEPLAHQLQRIPIVRAIGPDNAELTIVTIGLGVMVTRRLNEHAQAKQREELERRRRVAEASPEATQRDIARPSGSEAELLSVRWPPRPATAEALS